jgi:hypothetical protein
MKLPEIDRPIIVLGAPRSGTTLIFNTLASRSDLAWFSHHLSRLPRWPSVTVLARLAGRGGSLRKSIDRSDRARARLEKLKVGPAEAYPVWQHYCGDRFLFDAMADGGATEEERRNMRRLVAKVLRYEGKPRFATKITGPARIGYLSSIFPDARFLNVIRDGRAVVRSLLSVHFWGGTWRERQVAWEGVLDAEELARWQGAGGGQPLALAALQWRALVRGARAEAERYAPDSYAEIRYEDFVADPREALASMVQFCELPYTGEAQEFLARRVDVRDMNQRSRDAFTEAESDMLAELIGDELAELGYLGGSDHHERPLSRPFAGGPDD